MLTLLSLINFCNTTKQKQGHIINIASVAGFKVFAPGGAVYSATKFAIAEGRDENAGYRLLRRNSAIRIQILRRVSNAIRHYS